MSSRCHKNRHARDRSPLVATLLFSSVTGRSSVVRYMNVDLRKKMWCDIYARYKKTTATATTTMPIKCLRRHIACKAICATRALPMNRGNLIFVDILAVQARIKSQPWDRYVILERPFTASFRQDMACPGDPRMVAKQHKYSELQKYWLIIWTILSFRFFILALNFFFVFKKSNTSI